MLGGVGIGSGGKGLAGPYIGVGGRWVDGFVYWFCMGVKDAIEQILILDVNGWLGFEFIIFIFYFSVFQFTASKLYLWLIISFILKMDRENKSVHEPIKWKVFDAVKVPKPSRE